MIFPCIEALFEPQNDIEGYTFLKTFYMMILNDKFRS